MCLVLNIHLCKAIRYCSSPWLPTIQTSCKLILGQFLLSTFPPSPYAINSYGVYCSCSTNKNPQLQHVWSFLMVLLKYVTELTWPLQSSVTPAFPKQCSVQPWGSVRKCQDQTFFHSFSWTTWSFTHILLIPHSQCVCCTSELPAKAF